MFLYLPPHHPFVVTNCNPSSRELGLTDNGWDKKPRRDDDYRYGGGGGRAGGGPSRGGGDGRYVTCLFLTLDGKSVSLYCLVVLLRALPCCCLARDSRSDTFQEKFLETYRGTVTGTTAEEEGMMIGMFLFTLICGKMKLQLTQFVLQWQGRL